MKPFKCKSCEEPVLELQEISENLYSKIYLTWSKKHECYVEENRKIDGADIPTYLECSVCGERIQENKKYWETTRYKK